MDYFLHSVELPFSKIKLFYREINAKEQLLLAKSAILYPYGEENDFDYITATEKIILNCIENKEDFYKLNIIDYILFLTKLRIISIGKEVELEFEKVTKENMKIKSTIDLETFIKILYNTVVETKFEEPIEYKNIKIKLNWPNIKSKFLLLENKKNILITLTEFIEKMTVDENTSIDLQKFTTKQKEEIFDKFPFNIRLKIQNKVLEAITILVNKNLFNIDNMDWFRFTVYDSSYFHFLRLIFSTNLKSLYQENYLLAAKNINMSYVDKMSISDKKVYCAMVEEEFKSKTSNNSNQDYKIPAGNTSLADLISEFEG